MFHFRIATLAVAASLAWAAGASAADALPLGEAFKGKTQETGDTVTISAGPGGGGPGGKAAVRAKVSAFVATVDLKQGQKLEVSANVTSDDRAVVGIALVDKTGEVIDVSWRGTALPTKGARLVADKLPENFGRNYFVLRRSATLKVDRVPTDGEYTIRVLTDKEGDFSLLARDPSAKAAPAARTADAIRKELEAAEKRVEELKKELREKTGGNIGK